MEALKIVEQPIDKALALFDFKEAVFSDIESFKALEIVDTKTESEVRKARMSVRDLRYKIQNNQKEINADLNQKKKDVKEYAELLISRIEPVETDLDGKIKAVEQIREEKRLEKERIEKDRLDEIDRQCGLLEQACIQGLGYNLSSETIFSCLTALNEYLIKKEDFQERYEWAEGRILKGIEDTNAAYQARLKYEHDQEEQAKTRAAQEAEAKKLAEDRAKFEAEQAAARAEADKKAKEEAEKIRLANEKLEADREAIRKQEAEIEARKKADAERKYNADHEEAITINRVMVTDLAIRMNHEFDEARKEKLRADAERAKLISSDIEKLNQAHDHVFECWLKMVPVEKFDTQEGDEAFNKLKSGLGDLLSHFQAVIAELA